MNPLLEPPVEPSHLNIQFGEFIRSLCGGQPDAVVAAAVLVSQVTEQGHVCADLSALAGYPGDEQSLDGWLTTLRASPVVGQPGDYRPLILDGAHRLYLHRYWCYQHRIASRIHQWVTADTAEIDISLLRAHLDQLFPTTDTEIDWQKIAAAVAVLKPFCVISGGPGTGKTTTVTKILALLQTMAGDSPLRIVLCAPTGKAAARLQSSISASKQRLTCELPTIERIPENATTLHRLLGVRPGRAKPRYNRDNPLHADVLVMDEASMVDMAMMADLIDALPTHARLILLGDKDQLASVEAGSVLGDLCLGADISGISPEFGAVVEQVSGCSLADIYQASQPVDDAVVLLRTSYRFSQDSGIGRVAALINRGDGAGALASLTNESNSDVHWLPHPAVEQLSAALRQPIIDGFTPFVRAKEPAEALAQLERFTVLCAHRQGHTGVDGLNALVERTLASAGLIDAADGPWYPHRPVMITANDYTLGLFNGDIGVILTDHEGHRWAWFQTADGLQRLAPSRLPAHTTAFAMTVHKSQGSEFDQLLLALPDQASPVVTRELIYTAITRARKAVTVVGNESAFIQGVGQRQVRYSGLSDALRG